MERLWVWSGLGCAVVAAACFVIYGGDAVGAAAGTRATARFALCFLLAGFAAPGLRRWWPVVPEPADLIIAFVSAQMVHYSMVALLHTKFAATPAQIGVGQIVVVVGGFSLAAIAGVTARATRPTLRMAQTVSIYIFWLILAADYSQHPVKALRWMAIPVFAAMILRHVPVAKKSAAATAA
jgi:hypothetical protein